MSEQVEDKYLHDVIKAARKIQTFLWGIANGSWGLEEWRRMFLKRKKKIEAIDPANHHAMVEFKKRLLQNAALSVALLAILHEKYKVDDSVEIPTNLAEYAEEE